MSGGRLIVVMGVSGCGKSTLGQALAQALPGSAFVDADDLHSREAKAQMARGEPLTDAQRLPWVQRLCDTVTDHGRRGQTLVLAYSGLKTAHRARLRSLGVPAYWIWLEGEAGLLDARLTSRTGHFMPAALLASQLAAMEPPARDDPRVLTLAIDASPQQQLDRALSWLSR
ncbi:gluconokinase [Ferrimonas balearica]|uniref:gluconokinase n=1 Tax=Ferrimonas balearica TaxID=44012 RepID=UPI001C9A0395|nr:gluconokinase, GntK/IdnK-type [Ferrimonas balearica]MBY5992858.1 AAA family ATPase [Ferrimonas balearica]